MYPLMSTLLLIEDEHIFRDMLYEVMCPKYECHTADRAEQAFEYLELEDYDVVITDVHMPGLGGIEVLKRIREIHPNTPVIIISGTETEKEESLLEMGAFAFIHKPFQLEEVETTIVLAIAAKHRLNVPDVRVTATAK